MADRAVAKALSLPLPRERGLTGLHGGDGGRADDNPVSNGLHYVVIEQTLGGVTVTYDPATLLLGSNITSRITGISLSSTFDPYAGGRFPIRYELATPARVTITIKDGLGMTIGSVCSGALRAAGVQTEYWDGRLFSGAMIGPGQTFNVSILAIAVGGNALIVEDPLPPIEGLTASASKFMPALNPYGLSTNSLTLSYRLSAGADVRIEVRSASGRTVRGALEPDKSAGANRSVWPGTDDGGRLVAAGLYSVTLCVESGSRRGPPATVWVEVYY
jgi:flagellar hook assembly protein FlgD